jgi:hypothetical protein
MADGADVAVRLASIKLFFCHFFLFFTRRFIASVLVNPYFLRTYLVRGA